MIASGFSLGSATQFICAINSICFSTQVGGSAALYIFRKYRHDPIHRHVYFLVIPLSLPDYLIFRSQLSSLYTSAQAINIQLPPRVPCPFVNSTHQPNPFFAPLPLAPFSLPFKMPNSILIPGKLASTHLPPFIQTRFYQSHSLFPFSLPLPNKPLPKHHSIIPPRHRLPPILALDSDLPRPLHQGGRSGVKSSKSFEQWDFLTAKFAGAANIPFLLLQMPQIILNAKNLMAGNKTALLAVPWLAMLTGLLGNLSLLSYFAKKREAEAVVVQTLGVVSLYVVFAQLAMADAMPLAYFVVTSIVAATGLVLNFLNYFEKLNLGIWRFWEDFITICGLSVLPQVMWSTFVPLIPVSILPGVVSFAIALAAVIMARAGKLSDKGVRLVGSVSGWTATLLFMWMPVSQMWQNFLNPDNIRGLSAVSMLLAMMGNGLMLPRALFIRDFMWFTGSAWGTLFYGYGNILCMYCFNSISKEFFLSATAGLVSWIGLALWRDTVVHGYNSPFRSLKELVFGS